MDLLIVGQNKCNVKIDSEQDCTNQDAWIFCSKPKNIAFYGGARVNFVIPE